MIMYIQETVVSCMDIKGVLDLYYRGRSMYSPRATKQTPEGIHTTTGGSTNNTVTHRYPMVQELVL